MTVITDELTIAEETIEETIEGITDGKSIEEGYRIVGFTIKKYYTNFPYYEKSHGFEYADLRQIGIIGWWKALAKYDESKGKFVTFAIRYIRTEITDATRATYKGVKASKEVVEISKYIKKHRNEHLDDIQKRFGVSDIIMKRAVELSKFNLISGDKQIGDEDGMRIFDIISDESALAEVEKADMQLELERRLSCLSELQRSVLTLRLKGYKPEEIGEMLGRTNRNIITNIGYAKKRINELFNQRIENIA